MIAIANRTEEILLKKVLLIAVVAAFVLAGCPKKEASTTTEPAKKAEPVKAEPVKTPVEPVKKAEPAAAATVAASTGDPEKDCGALYDFMKAFMEQMQAKFGKGKPMKPFPAKDKFVGACKHLPGEAVRCMNPKTAMAEPQKCKETMAKVEKENKDAVAKFKALMK